MKSLTSAFLNLGPTAYLAFAALLTSIVMHESGRVAFCQEEKTPAVSPQSVQKFIRMLEADTLQERDEAEKRLVEMGSNILPFLPVVNARTSGELKIRLQRIRSALESSDVEIFFEASTVTLSGKLSVTDAISQIAEQTDNQIQLEGEDALAGVEVELNATDEPFWIVMNSIMKQANLRINAFGSTQGELVLVPGGQPRSGPDAFTTGPFQVETLSVKSSLQFGSNLAGTLELSLQATWEPRLKPVFMQIPMANYAARISENQSLAASNPQAAPEIPLNYGGCSTQIDLQFERPARTASTIEKLTGEFVMAVPSEKHQYVFQKFGNGARQSEKYGDVTVTLEGARRNGAVYEMRVLISFGNAQGALDSFRGWVLSNEAYLLDPKDVRLENVGLQTYAINNNAVGIAYLFQINGDPDDFKLVYESPGAISKQTVQFELENIELP